MASDVALGGDPADLRALAQAMAGTAQRLGDLRVTLAHLVHGLGWEGPDADRMRADWDAQLSEQLSGAASFLLGGADDLRAQADQQERASSGDTASGGSATAVASPGGGVSLTDAVPMSFTSGAVEPSPGDIFAGNSANLTEVAADAVTGGALGAAGAYALADARAARAAHGAMAADADAHVRALTEGGRAHAPAQHIYELMDERDAHLARAASNADDVRAPATLARAGRGLTILAVAATGYSIYDDMDHGESAAQAVASNAGGFVASMAAGAAAGALVGSIVPGPGTVVGAVVGTAVGTTVGLFTSGMIDSAWESGLDSWGEAGDAVVAGYDEVTSTFSDIGGMAAGAWRSVF